MNETLPKISGEHSDHPATEIMSLALDGMLEPGEQIEFDAHLANCQACRSAWLKWRRISDTLQVEPYSAPASGFILRVDQAIQRDETRRERMLGGLVVVGGALSVWTVLLVGLALALALAMAAFPEVRASTGQYLGYGGQVLTLLVRNLVVLRDGLLAMLPGPGILAGIAVALAVLAVIWLRLARSSGRQSVATGRQSPQSGSQ